MRLVVFTANQPRHVALVRSLSAAGHDLLAVFVEPKTFALPVESALLEHNMRMRRAEIAVFGGDIRMRAPVCAVRSGEISTLYGAAELAECADACVVFSASWIRPPLYDVLARTRTLNLHMGIAPAYRGSGCNFWAEYDGHPDLVGAQVQRLGAGLDDGEILAERRPPLGGDPFVRGMKAVQLGIKAMVAQVISIGTEHIPATTPIRVSRRRDFTEEIAADYLARLAAPASV